MLGPLTKREQLSRGVARAGEPQRREQRSTGQAIAARHALWLVSHERGGAKRAMLRPYTGASQKPCVSHGPGAARRATLVLWRTSWGQAKTQLDPLSIYIHIYIYIYIFGLYFSSVSENV